LSEGSETAYAKLNLALHVRGKRDDGYHHVDTVFAFCEDGDELSAEAAKPSSFQASGEFGAGIDPTDNLVTRAVEALSRVSGCDKRAAVHLKKRLPIASGLGGGSADAAATLRLLNRLWSLNVSVEKLEEIGQGLGADVPACIRSHAARGAGRGDELEPIDLDLSGRPVLLVNPRVELSTADIFSRWDGVDRGPIDDWRHGRNDLQQAAESLVPQVGGILAWLSAQPGADVVRMSGSGATCFALFDSESARDHAAMAVPREWWSLPTRLR
jgi:4-diphosphocytidyl-2-C-methyl-D-erythritol kinase